MVRCLLPQSPRARPWREEPGLPGGGGSGGLPGEAALGREPPRRAGAPPAKVRGESGPTAQEPEQITRPSTEHSSVCWGSGGGASRPVPSAGEARVGARTPCPARRALTGSRHWGGLSPGKRGRPGQERDGPALACPAPCLLLSAPRTPLPSSPLPLNATKPTPAHHPSNLRCGLGRAPHLLSASNPPSVQWG